MAHRLVAGAMMVVAGWGCGWQARQAAWRQAGVQ